jgi:spore photoproduct lyase
MSDSINSYQDQITSMQKTNQIRISNLKKKPIKVHFDNYKNLNGDLTRSVSRVGDGAIIKRFDKTPVPEKPNDVVCPHFLELKWAYGCPFKCAWCYLQGTFRFLKTKTQPVIKDRSLVESAIMSFLECNSPPEILNTGEVGDSLMEEGSNPFTKFAIPLFEEQNRHKILFLTKSDRVNHLLEIPEHKQTVISFSINSNSVAEKWEIGAPSIERRLKAAEALSDSDYEVRLRIDPIVPIIGWEDSYKELIDEIFGRFIPARITLGSLRGLQSTINNSRDRSWVEYLGERSNWGRKVAFRTRFENFSCIIDYLSDKGYRDIGLCKETVEMWDALGLNWKNIKCNCIF